MGSPLTASRWRTCRDPARVARVVSIVLHALVVVAVELRTFQDGGTGWGRDMTAVVRDVGEKAHGELWRPLWGSGVPVAPLRFTHTPRHTFDRPRPHHYACLLDAHSLLIVGTGHARRRNYPAQHSCIPSHAAQHTRPKLHLCILTSTRSFATESDHAISGWHRVF